MCRTEPIPLRAMAVALLLSAIGTFSMSAASGHSVPTGKGWAAGIVSSPDHVGVSARTPDSDGMFNSFTLTLEMRGIYDGKEDTPGVKFSFLHNHAISGGRIRGLYPWMLYVGPGVSAAYVRDNGEELGLMGGVAADIGLCAKFLNSLSIAVEFQADVAFFISDLPDPSMTSYKSGLYRSWMPVLRISYDF